MPLLHPFMPFITEELWRTIKPQEKSLSLQPWPAAEKSMVDKKSEDAMQTLIELITSIRNIRTKWNIDPQSRIDCIMIPITKKDSRLLEENTSTIKSLAKIHHLLIKEQLAKPKDVAMGIVGKIKFYIPLSGIIDIKKEKERIETQIKNQALQRQSLMLRMKNKDFLKKAPKEVVEKEKFRLKDLETKIKELKEVIRELR